MERDATDFYGQSLQMCRWEAIVSCHLNLAVANKICFLLIFFKKGARNTQHLSVNTAFVESESGKVTTQYDFQPSVGIHLIR